MITRIVFLFGVAALAAGSARADGPPPATLSISREVSYYEMATQAPAPATLAVSREVSYYEIPTQNPPPATLAVSREVSGLVNYTLLNAAAAMRIAAGLSNPTALEMQIYNLVPAGAPDDVVDLLDVVGIAVRAAHP